jgi:hypothetical protein
MHCNLSINYVGLAGSRHQHRESLSKQVHHKVLQSSSCLAGPVGLLLETVSLMSEAHLEYSNSMSQIMIMKLAYKIYQLMSTLLVGLQILLITCRIS